MKKIILYILMITLINKLDANNSTKEKVYIVPTSLNLESVTGLTFSEYEIKFSNKINSLIKDGLVLYSLDSFPCFAQNDKNYIILRSNKDNGGIRLNCLFKPKKLSFAWNNIGKNDYSYTKTKGILNCKTTENKSLEINLLNCEKGNDWKDYKGK